MSNPVSGAAKSGMDFLSKKMGLTGIFVGYLFYMSPGPEKLRVIMAAAAMVLYLIAQKADDCIAAYKYPRKFDAQGFLDRMSKTLTMAGGFLTALFAADFSPELKLWAGFGVTVAYLVLQGVYDGIKAYQGVGMIFAKIETSEFARPSDPTPIQ